MSWDHLSTADKIEAALQERARLDYTASVVRETMQSTKIVVQRLRFALAASGLARGVARSVNTMQQQPPAMQRRSLGNAQDAASI
jgi:hypothetical protein